jgi:hypothetical protein
MSVRRHMLSQSSTLTRLVSSEFSGLYTGSPTELDGSDPTACSSSMSRSSAEFSADSDSEFSNSTCCELVSELSSGSEESSFVAGIVLEDVVKEPLMAGVDGDLEGSESSSDIFEEKVEVMVGE